MALGAFTAVRRWAFRFWKWSCWVTESVHSVGSAKLPSVEDVRVYSPAGEARECLSPPLPAQGTVCSVENGPWALFLFDSFIQSEVEHLFSAPLWTGSFPHTAEGQGLARYALCKIQDRVCVSVPQLLAESLQKERAAGSGYFCPGSHPSCQSWEDLGLWHRPWASSTQHRHAGSLCLSDPASLGPQGEMGCAGGDQDRRVHELGMERSQLDLERGTLGRNE